MAQTKQAASAVLTPSWSLVPKNLELLRQRVEQVVVIVLLPTLLIDLGGIVMPSHFLFGWLILVAGVIWWAVNIGASYYLQISAAKEKIVSTADCYRHSWQYIGRLILFTFIFGIMVFIGLLLLIVPGLILLRRYFLSTYYIVDQNLSIPEAMEQSAKQSKPVAGYVWGTIGVVVVMIIAITVVSSLFFGIPGATVIISALLATSYFFIPALRYIDIVKHATKQTA